MQMSKKNKHKMSENFQSENDQEKEVLNSAEQNSETAQPDKEENNQEAQEETAETKLVKSEAEVADLKDRLLRQMAEFDNYRKRTMKEKAEIILNGSAGVVTDILPVIDDLERAIANSAKSEDYSALKEGVELIYNKLMHILEQKGLQKISPKVGSEKEAFLHYQDLGPQFMSLKKYIKQVRANRKKLAPFAKAQFVPFDEKQGNISTALEQGDEIIVQVTKEPISTKGPRLTGEISFAGRFLVLIPFSDKVSVSSKIKSN